MDTNKAAYWIALGVLALGLNSEYRQGSFVALHRVADRAGSVLCRISTRAEEAVALATGMTTRRAVLPDNVLAAADRAEMIREQARAQTELVREQVRNEILAQRDVLRAQADMRRAEIEQLRWRVRSDLRLASASGRRVAVLCPKTGKRVIVSQASELDPDLPGIEVSETF
ncbi:MAG: hypothetical protein LAO30_10245 [Acidobacteriia bacterium]|nr:hypothetical protein [Terriglobia bacterium]